MNHLNIVKMAWRNLLKNKRRTTITLLGIAFGIMLSILFTGLQDATWRETINMSARMGTGHITVQNRKYLDEPAVSNLVKKAPVIAKQILQHSHVTAVRERIMSHAMVATAAQSMGALVYGIDRAKENRQTFALLSGKLQGKFPGPTDVNGVVVGSKLAERLEITIGKKLVLTMTDKNGDIVSSLGRVRGILTTGSDSLDSTICITDINALRNILGVSSTQVTQLAVFIDDHRLSRPLAAALSRKGLAPESVDILPWQKINPDLDGLVATKMASAKVFELLILFLVAAGIFNTLYVSVMERMREFGILNAIGFSGGRLFSLVIWESLFTAALGLCMAALVTAIPYYYMYSHGINLAEMAGDGKEMTINGVGMATTIYVDIYVEKALAIAGVAVLGTLLSGLYPAYRAARVVPVESIKLV
ncbi:MAG: ABC transporter permease [Deltaproteobacteria bacterium]|nr:ABC transporter permease [Deltaproteobacteria bacterium]MBN2672639.1 ABC transporter permease [Deltaproteobacteria bacterium]